MTERSYTLPAIRVTLEERDAIRAQAEQHGLSVSQWVRQAAGVEGAQGVASESRPHGASRAKDSHQVPAAPSPPEPQWAEPPAIPPEMFEDSEDWQRLREQAEALTQSAPLKFKCPVCDKRFPRQQRCGCSNRMAVSV